MTATGGSESPPAIDTSRGGMTVRDLIATLVGFGVLGTGTVAFVWDGIVDVIADKVVEGLRDEGGELHAIEPLVKRYLFRVQLCATGHATADDCESWGLEVVDSHHEDRRSGRREPPIVVRVPPDPTNADLRRELREARAGARLTETEGGPP